MIQELFTRKRILIAISSLICILGIYVLYNYGFLEVTVSSPENKPVEIEVLDENGNINQKLTTEPGKSSRIFTKAGQYRVVAKQDDNETSVFSKTPRFLFTNKLAASIQKQRLVSKIASESLGCGYYIKSFYYSFNCLGETKVFRHTPLTQTSYSHKISIESNTDFIDIQAKGDSMIGLSNENKNFVMHELTHNPSGLLDKATPLSSYELGQPVLIKSGTTSVGILDRETRKVLIFDQNKIIKEIDIPEKIGRNYIIDAYISKDNLTILYGLNPSQGLGDSNQQAGERFDEHDISQSVEIISLVNNERIELSVPDQVSFNQIWYVNNGLLLETTKNQILFYSIESKALTNLTVLVNTYDPVVVGQDVYFKQDGSIYKFNVNTKTANLLISSNNLAVSAFQPFDDHIIFSAYTQSSEQSLPDAYMINPEKESANFKVEDFLPYTDQGLVLKMEYQGKILRVDLVLESFTSDKSAGTIYFDESEFESKKNEFIKKLEDNGLLGRFDVITINKRKIK